MGTITDTTTAVVGNHRTGASYHAVRLSDNSRVGLIPNSDGTCFYSNLKHHRVKLGNRERSTVIAPGSIAFAYGQFRTTVSRENDIITITIFDGYNDISHQIGNIDNFDVPIVSFDPLNDDMSEKYQSLLNGDTIHLISSGTYIDNRSVNHVSVKFLIYPVALGTDYSFRRDNLPRLVGMTYSDARGYMITDRVNFYNETEEEALATLENQTHQQIPTRHPRKPNGIAKIRDEDRFSDGSGPISASDLNYRMITIGKRLAINTGKNTIEDVLYVSKDPNAIRTYDGLKDIYGFNIGPNEASMSELVYKGLVADGKLVPDERGLLNSLLVGKFSAVNATDPKLIEYLTTYVDVKNREDGGTFTQGIVNLANARAVETGVPRATHVESIKNILNQVALDNLTYRVELASAYGEITSYSRKGIGKRFLNTVTGLNGGFRREDGLLNNFNAVAIGAKNTTAYDNTTGLFRAAEFDKILRPQGFEFTDGDVFIPRGYKKTFGPIGTFRSRPSVISWEFDINLSNIVFQNVSLNQENINRTISKIHELVDNAIDFLKMNINFWTQHIIGASWDNIALPLNNAAIFNVDDGEEPERWDRTELFVNRGKRDGLGDLYFDARFTANGDRLTFGVPDIYDLIEEDSLEPKNGYKTQGINNVNFSESNFLIVEEDNTFLPELGFDAPPIQPHILLNKSISDGEINIARTDYGVNIQEADYMNMNLTVQDRGVNRKSIEQYIPAHTGFSQMGEYVNDLYRELNSQSQSILGAPGYTFTGVVSGDFTENYFPVKPDGSNTVVRCQKLDGSASISKDDRVLVFERERGKYSAIRLPFTSESAETITMYPEYSNAAETTGEVNNTANNSVTSTFVVSGNTNFYRFSTSSPTAQDLSISVIIPIPAGIVELREVTLENKLSGVADAEIKVQVIDSDGVSDRNIDIPKSTTLNEYKIGGFSGTYTPGGIFRIVITGFCTSAETADIGKLVAKLR